jgi:hypothetical protein
MSKPTKDNMLRSKWLSSNVVSNLIVSDWGKSQSNTSSSKGKENNKQQQEKHKQTPPQAAPQVYLIVWA